MTTHTPTTDWGFHVHTPTRDDHTQYARADGARTFTGNVTVDGTITVTSLTQTSDNGDVPIGGLVASAVGPATQNDVSSAGATLFTVAADLVDGHKYEVTLSCPSAVHITAAATGGVDQIYCSDSAGLILPGAGGGQYLRAFMKLAAALNENLAGSSSCIIAPSSTASVTFTVTGDAGNAGALRCYADNTVLTVKRVA